MHNRKGFDRENNCCIVRVPPPDRKMDGCGRRYAAQVTDHASWPARDSQGEFVFQDRIWVAGGMSSGLTNEVWSLDVPAEWFEKK